jgi:hypothetical protein
MNQRNYVREIKEFQEYVWEFYNDTNGIYPIANSIKIQDAVMKYLESKPLIEIEFDSYDREKVREILQPTYKII